MRPLDLPGRFVVGLIIVTAVSWAPFACSSVSPTTRDAIVRTAFDEFRYQCEHNPPVDARLHAACLVVLDSERQNTLTAPDGSSPKDRDKADHGSPAPSGGAYPSDAGASFDPAVGNAVRYVGR